MKAAMDSPLEALDLNYLAHGYLTALNNIWACIALITAALSFWRIRALSSYDAAAAATPPPVADIPTEEPVTLSTTSETLVPAAPAEAPCGVLEREGSVKMKFSLYYEEDGGESEESASAEAVMSREAEVWGDDWERMMVMRMGDMGWYRWQDRTVLDGSVVRLWGGRSLKHAAAEVVGGGVAW